VKLKNLLGAEWLHPADEKTITDQTGLPCGFLGPVGLKLALYADHEVMRLAPFVTGANKPDAHLTGVHLARDLPGVQAADLREVVEGDPCPRCEKGRYKVKRGIEVGHIFILGSKYSTALKAHYLNAHGQEHPMVMGCYGIGVGRTAAAAIEQNHDEKGIIWPVPLAPFQVAVIPVNLSVDPVREAAETAYARLLELGIETLLDDRADRLGVKLNDADLLGIPLQIIIGPKHLEAGNVELKTRKTNASEVIPFPGGLSKVAERLKTL